MKNRLPDCCDRDDDSRGYGWISFSSQRKAISAKPQNRSADVGKLVCNLNFTFVSTFILGRRRFFYFLEGRTICNALIGRSDAPKRLLSINSRVCETVETYSEPASRAKAKRDGHSKLPSVATRRDSRIAPDYGYFCQTRIPLFRSSCPRGSNPLHLLERRVRFRVCQFFPCATKEHLISISTASNQSNRDTASQRLLR